VIAQASRHAWRTAQSLMESNKVIIDDMNLNHSDMVLELLGKGIRQARKAPHAHPHCQVVAFDIGGADMLGIGVIILEGSISN
jgi:hypothetical protein